MTPSFLKNEILTILEQMVPLSSNGLIYSLLAISFPGLLALSLSETVQDLHYALFS